MSSLLIRTSLFKESLSWMTFKCLRLSSKTSLLNRFLTNKQISFKLKCLCQTSPSKLESLYLTCSFKMMMIQT